MLRARTKTAFENWFQQRGDSGREIEHYKERFAALALPDTAFDAIDEALEAHKASPNNVLALLEEGRAAQDILNLYRLRDEINDQIGNSNVSIAILAAVCDAFPGADPGEELAGAIMDLHATCGRKHVSGSLNDALDVAERHDVADLRAVIAFLNGKGGKHDGVFAITQDEDDDVEGED